MNYKAAEFVPKTKMLSGEANEFVPHAKKEAMFYAKLQHQFIESNKWLFEHDPLKEYEEERARKKRKYETVSPTWADIVRKTN